jgi:hypothetical protein
LEAACTESYILEGGTVSLQCIRPTGTETNRDNAPSIRPASAGHAKGRSGERCGLEFDARQAPSGRGYLSSSPECGGFDELSLPECPHDGAGLEAAGLGAAGAGAAQLGAAGTGVGAGAGLGAAMGIAGAAGLAAAGLGAAGLGAAFFFAGLFFALAFLADFFGAAALDFLADFFADFLPDFLAFFADFLAAFFEDFFAEPFFAVKSFFLLFLAFLPFLFFFPLAIVILLLPPNHVTRAFRIVREAAGPIDQFNPAIFNPGFGPPVAQSRSSIVCTTGTDEPPAICTMHPILPAAIMSGLTLAILATFRSRNLFAMSG